MQGGRCQQSNAWKGHCHQPPSRTQNPKALGDLPGDTVNSYPPSHWSQRSQFVVFTELTEFIYCRSKLSLLWVVDETRDLLLHVAF